MYNLPIDSPLCFSLPVHLLSPVLRQDKVVSVAESGDDGEHTHQGIAIPNEDMVLRLTLQEDLF